jgi:hypothetical protein
MTVHSWGGQGAGELASQGSLVGSSAPLPAAPACPASPSSLSLPTLPRPLPQFEYSEQLWPWSGYLALYLRVKDEGADFLGTASGTVSFTVVSPPGPGEAAQRHSLVSVPLTAAIIPTPHRWERVSVWVANACACGGLCSGRGLAGGACACSAGAGRAYGRSVVAAGRRRATLQRLG